MHFLRHLAEVGANDIHPLGATGSAHLLESLNVESGHRVLEIGCGTGMTLARILTARDVLLVGLDDLPEMLQAAKQRLRWARVAGRTLLIQGNGQALPFQSATYDRVYTESVMGFQTADAAKRMLAEVFRVLQPGGLYVANEAIWKAGVPTETIAEVYRTNVEDFGLCQASEQPWTHTEWTEQMRFAGFDVDSSELLAPSSSPVGGKAGKLSLTMQAYRIYHIARKRLRPGLSAARREYRRRIQRHAADGQYIEARLFVLRKA
jgi:cyclopropane fatty-acyl-phospholipid synthase-like methyltransferase